MLLDNYMKAKSQLLEGLGIEPFHEGLQKALLEVQQHLTGGLLATLRMENSSCQNLGPYKGFGEDEDLAVDLRSFQFEFPLISIFTTQSPM